MSAGRLERRIVVDGERWQWEVAKVPDWSEYTPAGAKDKYLTLRGPDGYQRTHEVQADAITPAWVESYIRTLVKEGRWP